MQLASHTRKEWADIIRKRIQIAQKLHKEKIIEWAEKVLKEYSGESHRDETTGERYKQVAQIAYSVEETVQPHLYFQNPRMVVKANRFKPGWARREPLVEEMVNHEYKEIKEGGYGIELENELALIDARILGYGVTFTSYDVEGEILVEPPEEGMLAKTKNFLTGQTTEPKRTSVITKEIGHVTEHLSAMDVYLDPTAQHITKQKTIIRVMDLSMEDLKKSRYEQDKVEKLQPTVNFTAEIMDMSDDDRKRLVERNPDFKGFRAFEVHDLENKVTHTMIDGGEDFIEFASPALLREGSQFNFLWFKEEPREVYPSPPFRFYRKRALEFSYIYSQISEQIDKFMPKIGVDIDRLDAPEKARLRSGGLGSIFATKGPPEAAVHVFTSQGNIDSLLKYLVLVKEMLNTEAATDEYELASPEKRKATEAIQIKQGTSARRFKPKKRMAGYIKNQAHTIWGVIRDHYPIEKFAEVLGPEQAFEWWTDEETGKKAWMTDEALKDYAFDFDMDSMAPIDDALKKKQNIETATIIQTLNQLAMGIGMKLSPEIIEQTIKKIVDENLKVRVEGSPLVQISQADILLQQVLSGQLGGPPKKQPGKSSGNTGHGSDHGPPNPTPQQVGANRV